VPEPIQTPGGVVIEDLTVGEGPEVQPAETVTIHYRGELPDGTEFDSSYGRGQPATFSLTQLIKGWQEGIPGMKVGGKRRLTIPPALGYGSRGVPGTIPPNSPLLFEIELLGIAR
jgi:FKBP-type peptidyl-prolyl cis-trans isomerase FkpA